MLPFAISAFIVTIFSGLYTSLWGAFKDSPFEGLKGRTFPRSIYFSVGIFLVLFAVPASSDQLKHLGLFEVFFLIMGAERVLAELYKGFLRSEDQSKYFVPSRITFFGRYVTSDLLRYAIGLVLLSLVLGAMFIDLPIEGLLAFALVGYCSGLAIALGGAYKDAPFEGFKVGKFQRSGVVLALASPLFFWISDPVDAIPLGFLIFMNGGLERFVVEYYKTYVQRNMSGKFRPDIERRQDLIDRRETFHYLALAIIAAVVVIYVVEYLALGEVAAIEAASVLPAAG